jgi:hypothetical protein
MKRYWAEPRLSVPKPEETVPGGHADTGGIELWCKTCRQPVLLEQEPPAALRLTEPSAIGKRQA